MSRKSKRSKEKIKSKSREIRSVNSSNTLYLQVQEIQKNKSIETVMHIQKGIWRSWQEIMWVLGNLRAKN